MKWNFGLQWWTSSLRLLATTCKKSKIGARTTASFPIAIHVQKSVYIFCQKLGGIFDCNPGWCLLTPKASYCQPLHVRSRKLGHASLYPHQTKNGPFVINVRCESSRRYRLLTSKLTHHSSAVCWVLQIQFSALWRPNEEGVSQFQQGLLRNSCNVFWFAALNVTLCTAKISKKP